MAELDTVQLKYIFRQEETVGIAKDLGRHMQTKVQAEEELDSIKSAHRAKVMHLDADISDCTRKIMSGYEMRNIRCLLLKARPDNDSLLVVRTDNGRVVSRRKMNADERQIKITTDPPEIFTHEADFYDDSEGDISVVVAEDCPITRSEAKELGAVEGLRIRPITKKLEASAE
jgi:hypothetical protein